MMLTDLHPQWENADAKPWDGEQYKRLGFDCPKCLGTDLSKRLSIPIPPHPRAWGLPNGEDFKTLTLTPSVDFKHGDWDELDPAAVKCHAHFYVKDGAIEML